MTQLLDPSERERVRYHLGYPDISQGAGLVAGVPLDIQTMFLVELSMDNVLDVAVDRVRKLLTTLDCLECKMQEGAQYLVANKLDSLEIRPDYLDKLEDEYSRWACRLADLLGCPLYPGSDKFRRLFNKQRGVSVPVRGNR